MNPRAPLRDRLRSASIVQAFRPAATWMAHLLSPHTTQEHDRRRAHLFALLLVAVVGTAKHVTGLTEGSATYTVYMLAIAVSGLLGGFAPACVAVMASVLLAGAYAHTPSRSADRLLFALEGLGMAAVVASVGNRVRAADEEIETLEAAGGDLRGQARRGHLTHNALHHLEEMAPDVAVFVVNAQGLIVEWSFSAERMYGRTAEEIVGSSITAILSDGVATTDVQALLGAKPPPERTQLAGVHRRSDGTRVHVELEVKPCRAPFSELFTIAVHDMSRQRESGAFREAALRAQTALQKAADDAQSQLAALESLTDPSINPAAGSAAIGELVERLRSSLRADGIALVQLGRAGTRVVSGAGLRPTQVRAPGSAATSGTADGRVALVHNDAARVAQLSALAWPPTVSSIMVVPVCHTGQAGFRLEVVNERRAPATEWDLALARIVADRLTPAIARQSPADSGNAVA